MNEDCLFCRITNGSLPSTLLHEDEQCVAVEDIFPKAPVHLLILPKAHLSSALQVGAQQEALVGHLVAVAAKLAKEKGLSDKGFRLVFNTGTEAGQTVPHLHLHLLGGHPLGNMG